MNKDAKGDDYDGATKKYVVHIDPGQMPVKRFWSLTMYDDKYFFVPNPMNRYTLSQRNKLVTNSDGSVDLDFQAASPGKAKEANWLPAPKAKFIPMLRLYWPNEKDPSILDGSWVIPGIKEEPAGQTDRSRVAVFVRGQAKIAPRERQTDSQPIGLSTISTLGFYA